MALDHEATNFGVGQLKRLLESQFYGVSYRNPLAIHVQKESSNYGVRFPLEGSARAGFV